MTADGWLTRGRETTADDVGAVLRAWRQVSRRTQVEVAEALAMTQQHLSQMENGQRPVSIDQRRLMVTELGIAAEDLGLSAGLDSKFYRADGASVFVKPGSERFATDTQLLGEGELRAAAVRRGAPTLTEVQADEVLARFARSGRALGADQAAALRGILTSGAAVEVLTAPAGTGKSFLVGTLAETWPQHGPDAGGEGRRVFGLAYGQRQADILTEEGVTSQNITRWLAGQTRLDTGAGSAADEGFRLRSGDLVVVDEAGAAATGDLVAIQRRAEAAGVKLLLVGDPKQLGAVGAGGALADIAERGIRYELAEVRRFHQEWEGPRRCGSATATPRRSPSTPSTAAWSTAGPRSRRRPPRPAPGSPTPSPGRRPC